MTMKMIWSNMQYESESVDYFEDDDQQYESEVEVEYVYDAEQYESDL